VVTKVNTEALKQYGHMKYFEEMDKTDESVSMEKKTAELLSKLSKVKTTANITGINPNQIMPQLYSADVIYVEEPKTKLIGAYHILNITQEFVSDNLINLEMEIQQTPDIPEAQYPDAVKKAKEKAGTGVQQAYSKEVKGLMDKYGL
jgi:hypothetical protein